MKFLLDANVRRSVGTFLASLGHDVRFLAGTDICDASDDLVLHVATTEHRILVTNDKDFGHLIYRQQRLHHGVILFRLQEETAAAYQTKLHSVLKKYGETLINRFTIITDSHVRLR